MVVPALNNSKFGIARSRLSLVCPRVCGVSARACVSFGRYDIMVGMIKRGVIPMPTTILSSAKDLQYRIQSAQVRPLPSVSVRCCS